MPLPNLQGQQQCRRVAVRQAVVVGGQIGQPLPSGGLVEQVGPRRRIPGAEVPALPARVLPLPRVRQGGEVLVDDGDLAEGEDVDRAGIPAVLPGLQGAVQKPAVPARRQGAAKALAGLLQGEALRGSGPERAAAPFRLVGQKGLLGLLGGAGRLRDRQRRLRLGNAA